MIINVGAGVPRGLWAVDRRKMAYSLRDRINTCSTIYDFEQLDNLHNTMSNKHVAVVGGGFLGTAHHPPPSFSSASVQGPCSTSPPSEIIHPVALGLPFPCPPWFPPFYVKGTELALALSVRARESGMTVSQIFAEKAPLSRYIPLYLALHTQRLLHTAGVRCIAERLVTDVRGRRLEIVHIGDLCTCVFFGERMIDMPKGHSSHHDAFV